MTYSYGRKYDFVTLREIIRINNLHNSNKSTTFAKKLRNMKKNIITVNVSLPEYACKLTHKKLKLIGEVDLSTLATMLRYEFDYIDISKAEFGTNQEKRSVCLDWIHSGPVNGNSGYRDMGVLRRFLAGIKARTILLPDNVQRRHINAAKKNPNIKELQVSKKCRLFAYEDGKLMNKKKTKPVFNCKLHTFTGEIRGTWDTWQAKIDIPLSDAEVEKIKELIKDANTDNLLYIIEEQMPNLHSLLDWHFYDLAWKQKVEDGLGYGLSKAAAENVNMTGNEYTCFIPEEFESDD